MRARLPAILGMLGLVSAAQAAPIMVGNFIWRDTDADGVQDAVESGMSGVTVQLWNGAKTQLIDSTVTNATGMYELTAPGSGTYRVRVVRPAADAPFSPKNQGANDQTDSDVNPTGPDLGFTDPYTFPANLVAIATIDTGIVPPPSPITVGNCVWRDLDADGIQDAGEAGAEDITVQLWNAAKTQLIDTDTTTAAGAYALTAPGPGDYRVRVILPAADVEFSPKDQGGNDQTDSDINPSGMSPGFTDPYTFPSNLIATATIDAGLVFPSAIAVGDFVWDDVDKDGIQDASEPGMPDVVVQLWNEARNQLLDSTVTDGAGNYALIADNAGSYRVRVVRADSADAFTSKDQGGNDARDSDIHPDGSLFGFTDTLFLEPGDSVVTTVDAGLEGPRIFVNGFE